MNYPDSGTSNGVGALLTGIGLFAFIFSLAVLVFFIIVYWRIAAKAGYNGALSLLLLVPIANIVLICVFAFSEWPVLRELKQLRQQVAAGPQQYSQYPQYQQYPQNMQHAQQYQQYAQNPAQQQHYPQYPQNPQ